MLVYTLNAHESTQSHQVQYWNNIIKYTHELYGIWANCAAVESEREWGEILSVRLFDDYFWHFDKWSKG